MRKAQIIAATLLLACLAVGIVTYLVFIRNPKPSAEESPLPYPDTNTERDPQLSGRDHSFVESLGFFTSKYQYSGFTGKKKESGEIESPVAVIVENHGFAVPNQTGLTEAAVVYETYAEGGITRFLSILPKSKITRIGPVRSLRPYFLDWAEEHAFAIIHAGGSEEALEELTASGLFNIDEDELYPELMYRDEDIERPHNLFANLEKIRAFLPSSEYPWKAMPLQFHDASTEGVDATQIEVRFGEPYNVVFGFLKENSCYLRYERDTTHRDAITGIKLCPTNVIVQITDMEVIDDIGRLKIRTLGTGKSLLFSGGKMITGTWSKKGGETTNFLDEKGVPFSVLPGQTWIVVIDSEKKILHE